jgi:hypothetical protein
MRRALLAATDGTGSGPLALSDLTQGSRTVNLRVACLGAGSARITDAHGALVLIV